MTLGLVLTALTLGLRHGVDWDHLAAIADLSGTAESRRRGFWLSFLYALGHAAVVLVLGALAIVAGTTIPDSVDAWMGRVVGVTLIALGIWVLAGLVRHRRAFRLRSRWMLVLDGTFAGLRRVRTRRSGRSISIEHDHDHDHAGAEHDVPAAHDHSHREVASRDRAVTVAATAGAPNDVDHGATPVSGAPASRPAHAHRHRHDLALPDSPAARYDGSTAAGIGMLHGVGIESPTQIAIFVASTSVVGAWGGLALLLAWVVGLIVANSVLAVLAGAGILHAERNFAVYATLAVLVAVMSIGMGALFALDIDALPAIEL